MAKGCYVGVNGVARKVKKIYVGVDGIARKVKKAYIGVGGVARLFWRSGPSYYGTATKLNVGRRELAATTVGNYALFAGGASDTTNGILQIPCSTVDAYDKTLTRTSAVTLKPAKYSLAATTVGDYALFAGGRGKSSSDMYADVDAYNTSLSKSFVDDLSYARFALAATTVGDYALFAGGYNDSGSSGAYTPRVDIYNSSLTKFKYTTFPIPVSGTYSNTATTVGNYALFAGGYNNQYIVVFNTSLTSSYIINGLRDGVLRGAFRADLAATTVGDYALFAGGRDWDHDTLFKYVDAYDTSLTHYIAADLSVEKAHLAATTLDEYALFAGGGEYFTSNVYADVDVYDASLTKSSVNDLAYTRLALAAATVGNYALFAGGYSSKTGKYYDTVDVYTI